MILKNLALTKLPRLDSQDWILPIKNWGNFSTVVDLTVVWRDFLVTTVTSEAANFQRAELMTQDEAAPNISLVSKLPT